MLISEQDTSYIQSGVVYSYDGRAYDCVRNLGSSREQYIVLEIHCQGPLDLHLLTAYCFESFASLHSVILHPFTL